MPYSSHWEVQAELGYSHLRSQISSCWNSFKLVTRASYGYAVVLLQPHAFVCSWFRHTHLVTFLRRPAYQIWSDLPWPFSITTGTMPCSCTSPLEMAISQVEALETFDLSPFSFILHAVCVFFSKSWQSTMQYHTMSILCSSRTLFHDIGCPAMYQNVWYMPLWCGRLTVTLRGALRKAVRPSSSSC